MDVEKVKIQMFIILTTRPCSNQNQITSCYFYFLKYKSTLKSVKTLCWNIYSFLRAKDEPEVVSMRLWA